MARMTLTNDKIVFTSDGIYIHPTLSDPFRFSGSVAELINIMAFHTELDIDNTRFRVREHDAYSLQSVHGNLCYKCQEFHTKEYKCNGVTK